MQTEHYCPVCGFDLGFQPWSHGSGSQEICPSCGIQFGYTDAAGGDVEKRKAIYQKWREDWIKKGMLWDSNGGLPPEHWDPVKQLRNIRINLP